LSVARLNSFTDASKPVVPEPTAGELLSAFSDGYSQLATSSSSATELFEDFRNAAPRCAQKARPSDDERAEKAVTRQAHRLSIQPTRTDPRVQDLRETVLMNVKDAAFLYGVSKDVVYAECRRGNVPHKKFGARIRVLTRHVFAELGLD